MDLSSLAGTLLKFGGTVIGTALGGPAGGAVAGTIIGELAKQFGTEATPEAVSAAIAADPEAAAKIQAVESSKAADDLADLNARLADVQDAREMQNHAVDAGSWTAAMPTAQTVFNWLMAVGVILGVAMDWLREDGIIVGFGIGAYTMSNNFWLGSSSGSKRSGDAMRQIVTNATASTAGQIIGKAIDTVGTKAVKR